MAELYNYIVNTGVIVPDTSELKNDITTEYQDALGSDMNTTAGTPQGRLIDAETISRSSVIRTNSLTANMFNIRSLPRRSDVKQCFGNDYRCQRYGHPGKLPSQHGKGSYFLPRESSNYS